MTTVLKLDEIRRLIATPQLIQEIETGFVLYSEGKVVVPPVGFLHFDQPPGDVHIKYGFVTGDEYYVLKMASGFYNNPELGPKNIHHIGIVGTGVQARMQLELLRTVVDCKRCFIWGRNSTKVQGMIEDLRATESVQAWGLDIQAAETLDELVSQCNLVVTTTSAREPLIRADQVQEGTHITAMGSDDHGKQELEADLLAKADRVVADSVSQCIDHGECFHAVKDSKIEKGSILELGNVIKKPEIGRTSEDQITVADLTGVAIQDIQIAKMVDRVLHS